MERNTWKQLMNLGLKLGFMLKEKFITKACIIWEEMKFTPREKQTLKDLLSKKGKRKEILHKMEEEISQNLGLTEVNGEDIHNLKEKLREVEEKVRQGGGD